MASDVNTAPCAWTFPDRDATPGASYFNKLVLFAWTMFTILGAAITVAASVRVLAWGLGF